MTPDEIRRVEALSTVLLEKRLLVDRLNGLIELITEVRSQPDQTHPAVTIIHLGITGHQIGVPASIRPALLSFLKALRAQAEAWLGDLTLTDALATAEQGYRQLAKPHPWATFDEVLDDLERATGTGFVLSGGSGPRLLEACIEETNEDDDADDQAKR